jgi:transcriptional regulator GlxA family with amidase domain
MDARVESVITTMHRSLTDELSIPALSGRVNLSCNRLRQLFVKEVGQSPIQYLRSVRIRRAEYLLRNTFLSIKEVASLSGINDVSHFVRYFKKQFGRTPSNYRNASRLNTQNVRFVGE